MKDLEKRNSKIKEMDCNGMSVAKIATLYNLSRVSIYKILKTKKINYYISGWKKIREEILKRDNNTCQWGVDCNPKKRIKKSKLHVHHIDENRENNNPKNLITLCSKCHNYYHTKIAYLIMEEKINAVKFYNSHKITLKKVARKFGHGLSWLNKARQEYKNGWIRKAIKESNKK